jgi:branched-chain amino acid transport system permease protein
MVGLGLLFFGAEGQRTPAFSDASLDLGALTVSGQTLVVVFTSLACIAALYFFFERTLYGKALRATAINRVGARLMGIAPITTIYYDTGFLIGLKGFVAAIIGGLASYPLAALGALLVGLLEAFSSFWASEYKEVIVFTLIIPVLLWRSLKSTHVEDEE